MRSLFFLTSVLEKVVCLECDACFDVEHQLRFHVSKMIVWSLCGELMNPAASTVQASDIQMDYMKLLGTQLQNQNPPEPLDN
ncbi:MAG: hypothetical protein JSU70_04060 [Phycisphaerales bacterium]|nr:MAG: hypothetical protein JSU70_04060 [Phycisphaerales bacterium]